MAEIKKILKLLIIFFTFLFLIMNAYAFGYFRNSDIYDFVGMHGFGMLIGFGIFAIAIGILLFVFWLWMLIDCLKRDFKKDYEKIVLVLVMIFVHLLGAVIYYFVVKVSDKEISRKKS